jgi:hypothetical protein
MYSIDGANSTPVNSYSGNQPMTIYQFPDTLDKDVPLFRLTLPLPIASISTLFLTGTASSPDTLFTTDVLPYHTAADSTMGIRFMNLSPGSRPVNIRVKGQSGAPIGSNLAYKGTTRFMIMPAGTQQGDYTFEFRDAVTETLLISYTTKGIQLPPQNFRNAWTYRNSTLALMGLPGGTGETALGVSHISY